MGPIGLNSGVQVVAIGKQAERTQQVAANGRIATIVADPTDMIGKVDAVFRATRHGGLHRQVVTPDPEAGIPTFEAQPAQQLTLPDARVIAGLAC